MKRALKSMLILLLTVVYMTASMGFSVHSHYCCGKKVSANFWEKKIKCGCYKTSKAKDCCRDEVTAFKIKDNYKNATAQIVPKAVSEIFLHAFLRIFQPTLPNQLQVGAVFHTVIPPLLSNVPLFLQYRLLLI